MVLAQRQMREKKSFPIRFRFCSNGFIRIQTISKWIQKVKARNITKLMQDPWMQQLWSNFCIQNKNLKLFLNLHILGVTGDQGPLPSRKQ
jgi:hypothetical protein